MLPTSVSASVNTQHTYTNYNVSGRRGYSDPLTTTELALQEYDVAALMDRLANAIPSLREALIEVPLPRRRRINRIGTLVTINAERLVRYEERRKGV